MLTVGLLIALAAFIVTIAHAMNKCVLWPAVLLLAILHLLQGIPLGR